MKKVDDIIDAITKKTSIARIHILHSSSMWAVRARYILFYIMYNDTVYGVPEMAEITGMARNSCNEALKKAQMLYSTDNKFRNRVEKIRHAMSAPPKEEPKIKANPFGIKYTEEDELRMKWAIASANEFMKNYGKGQMPLKDGYYHTRNKTK